MSKLILNVGDKVRNINKNSSVFRQIGEVKEVSLGCYHVVFECGYEKGYNKQTSHVYLEKVVSHCPCSGLSGGVKRDEMIVITTDKRKLIKRERINVISGKTQDEMVAMQGHARGVQQFNTRCLGRTTGQAFLAIGQAMCSPGTEIRISKVDHAKEQELCSTSWKTLDERFRGVVECLLGDMKGFSFTDTHLVYHPIQTVETYVEYKQ